MDRRITASNGRVAAAYLRGKVKADQFVVGVSKTVARPCVNLQQMPSGKRDRQVLFGDEVVVLEDRDGWSFVTKPSDKYVGYVPSEALIAYTDPTHIVGTPATHLYTEPDIKAPDVMRLGFFSQVRVTAELKAFYETDFGYIPKKHLRPLDRPFADPVTIAQLHFGVPYLWGGNSTLGIDCSGLVQAALRACAIACPGDSDMQEAAFGGDMAKDAPTQRGDLLFWKGHVAMAVDPDTLIHANAHHMAVAYEPIKAAITRIAAQGGGPVTSRKRL